MAAVYGLWRSWAVSSLDTLLCGLTLLLVGLIYWRRAEGGLLVGLAGLAGLAAFRQTPGDILLAALFVALLALLRVNWLIQGGLFMMVLSVLGGWTNDLLHGDAPASDRPLLVLLLLGGLTAVLAIQHSATVDRLAVVVMLRRETEQALRQAQALSLAKARFLGSLGHELRTPLTAILSMMAVLQDGIGGCRPITTAASDQGMRVWLDAVVANTNRLLRLFNATIDLARLEAGALPERKRPLSVRVLLEGTFGERLAQVSVASDLPERARFDENKMRTILTALVDVFPEFPQVRVWLDERGWLAVSIGLTTASFPFESEQVFDMVYQLSREDDAVESGIRLGPPLAAALSQLLGGTLILHDHVFEVRLPLETL